MIFIILYNFSGIFLILLKCIFNFFKYLNQLKKCKKGVFFTRAHVDATWHAWPIVRTARVPAWHGGDVSIFIFTRISMVIVHISIQ